MRENLETEISKKPERMLEAAGLGAILAVGGPVAAGGVYAIAKIFAYCNRRRMKKPKPEYTKRYLAILGTMFSVVPGVYVIASCLGL